MKCEELLALLNEYVDGTADPAICKEFDKHLAGCNPCQIVVDNIRKTITLYKDGRPYQLPVQFRDRLHDVLRRRFASRCRQNRSKGGSIAKIRKPSRKKRSG